MAWIWTRFKAQYALYILLKSGFWHPSHFIYRLEFEKILSRIYISMLYVYTTVALGIRVLRHEGHGPF